MYSKTSVCRCCLGVLAEIWLCVLCFPLPLSVHASAHVCAKLLVCVPMSKRVLVSLHQSVNWLGDDHTGGHTPSIVSAPSSKEGCRKSVLGVWEVVCVSLLLLLFLCVGFFFFFGGGGGGGEKVKTYNGKKATTVLSFISHKIHVRNGNGAASAQETSWYSSPPLGQGINGRQPRRPNKVLYFGCSRSKDSMQVQEILRQARLGPRAVQGLGPLNNQTHQYPLYCH